MNFAEQPKNCATAKGVYKTNNERENGSFIIDRIFLFCKQLTNLTIDE